MADLRSQHDPTEPVLRREVILPPARDTAALHRGIAVLSICLAVFAGMVDAVLWQVAQREARAERIETMVDARRAEARRQQRLELAPRVDDHVSCEQVRDAGDATEQR